MRVLIHVCKNDSPATVDVPDSIRKAIREIKPKAQEGQLGWQVVRSSVYDATGLYCLVYCKSKAKMNNEELSFFSQIRKAIVEDLRIEFVHVPTES